ASRLCSNALTLRELQHPLVSLRNQRQCGIDAGSTRHQHGVATASAQLLSRSVNHRLILEDVGDLKRILASLNVFLHELRHSADNRKHDAVRHRVSSLVPFDLLRSFKTPPRPCRVALPPQVFPPGNTCKIHEALVTLDRFWVALFRVRVLAVVYIVLEINKAVIPVLV